MKKLFFILLIPFFLYSYTIEIFKWGKDDTFYSFLKKNNVPFSIYYSFPKKIRKSLNHIPPGNEISVLRHNNRLKQALIPINDKKQVQIINKNGKFYAKIVPIVYQSLQFRKTILVNHYLNYDVFKATHSLELTKKIFYLFKDKVNFRALPYNTKIDLVYEEKFRFGKVKELKILYAKIYNKFYKYTAFLNPYDNRYYNAKGISLSGMFLKAPLKYRRISSYFGMRFHPILHKWKMHDGVDFVNKIGTPIHSIADGKVIYKGWIRGYGRSVKIKHKNGYISLYAHLHGYKKGLRVGKYVKQGDVIGYLGNSGLSTGPHLHLGVMHNRRWINPLKLKNVKVVLKGYKKRKFLAYIRSFSENNNIALK